MTLKRKVATVLAAAFIAMAITAAWVWRSRGPVIRAVALDLRAGARARHAEKPFERFLELRYGSMTDATNRQQAFLGFFDTAHMEGMYRMVRHMTPEERQKNITATAQWLETYRQTMSEAEKQALSDWLNSAQGLADVQRASALYRSRDVGYRSSTEPVIRELMTTLAELKQAQ